MSTSALSLVTADSIPYVQVGDWTDLQAGDLYIGYGNTGPVLAVCDNVRHANSIWGTNPHFPEDTSRHTNWVEGHRPDGGFVYPYNLSAVVKVRPLTAAEIASGVGA